MLQVVEVPRRLGPHVSSAVFGALAICVGVAFWFAIEPDQGEPFRWTFSGGLFALGAYKLVANVRMLAARTPALRASSDGIWFGSGPMIPWLEISAIYPGRERLYQLPNVAISFRRTRTLLRLPLRLWITTAQLGDVAIPVNGIYLGTRTLIARLEALRTSGDVTLPGAHVELPTARVMVAPDAVHRHGG